MLNQAALIESVQKTHPGEDLSLLAKAYAYAEHAHEGQRRKSGAPFFTHPLQVAIILNEMRLDVPSIIAGLLHDTVEDTTVSVEEISRDFNPEIAFLVDGVTKLDKIIFTSREDKQAENFRKMIVAMAKDIRVLLIKLADRLNNMRTIEHLALGKRELMARETLEIYAPLANRLGMSRLKMELQDLSIATLKPEFCAEVKKKLEIFGKDQQDYIEKVEKKVRTKLEDAIPSYEIRHRFKHLFGICHKIESQNLSFEQVHDLVGFRVIVQNLEECYEALGLIHSLWKPIPGRIKDYIALPKANHYQSLHTTVICEEGHRVEFQIRTREMHDIAERGIAAHWEYKEGGRLGEKESGKFKWLRQLLNWKEELDTSEEFLDTLKLDLFTNEVYVFTPKGDVKEVPYGSTPIDLAYAVHSAVGDKCSGAKVNDRIVPLSYVLKSGDVVEILTSPSSKPNKDWLKFAKTSRARSHIRKVTRDEQRARSIQIGRELLDRECRRFHLTLNKVLHSTELEAYLPTYPFQDADALLAALGYGKVSPLQVLGKIFPKEIMEAKPKEELKPTESSLIQRIFKKVASRSRNLVKVSGLDDVLVAYGKCCHPLPGDSIAGFVTRGRGVTVHAIDCPKVLIADPERRIEVEWDTGSGMQETRAVKIRIIAEDRPGLLSEISQSISEKGLNILGAQVRTTRDKKAISMVEVGIPNLEELRLVMLSLQRVAGVLSVERMRT